MKTWLQTIKREHIISMLLTMGIVGISTAAHAAGGGEIPGWAAMGNMMNSVQGMPMMAVGTGAVIGAAYTLSRGELSMGAKQAAMAVGATGLGCGAAGALNTWGVAGALAKAQVIASVVLS